MPFRHDLAVVRMTIPLFPDFTDLTLSHYTAYDSATQAMRFENADLSFPEIFGWRKTFKPYVARLQNSLCPKLVWKERTILFPPIGTDTFSEVQDDYMAYLKPLKGNGYIGGLRKEEAEQSGYTPQFDRNNSDYLYRSSDLADLPGKKYHPKRNLIRQFEKKHSYQYVPLDCREIEGCLELSEAWCNIKKCNEDDQVYAEEQAVREMLTHCFDLNIFGGVIYIEDTIRAFTLASRLNEDTVVVHAEKADTSFKGIYQAINAYFARSVADRFTWINRESDIGNEGLRKAKLSYYPTHLNEKYYIRVANHVT
ncbi:MAG: DUF2156 domain-containing protein [Elusimicrobia bacterium]|nr:DUF2156 domain-containing protein [Elusimicrobiota bacterium]MBD3411626.1 DUF2156 domain-containing protein [Elusimicrobiota bacterium]